MCSSRPRTTSYFFSLPLFLGMVPDLYPPEVTGAPLSRATMRSIYAWGRRYGRVLHRRATGFSYSPLGTLSSATIRHLNNTSPPLSDINGQSDAIEYQTDRIERIVNRTDGEGRPSALGASTNRIEPTRAESLVLHGNVTMSHMCQSFTITYSRLCSGRPR